VSSTVVPPHVLREYALIADGERGALIGPRGELAWLCFPRWDSEAVFSGLIGGTGSYLVTPHARFVWGGYYEPGGLVWRSRWVTDDGIVECREALALPAAPGRALVLRRVLAREGDARLAVVLEPRPGFGRHRTGWAQHDGAWEGRGAGMGMRWSGAADAVERCGALALDLRVPAGGHHDLVLELSVGEPAGTAGAEELWRATEAGWRERVPPLEQVSLARRDARHAIAVMSGLTSAGGGMVAAATTSLPERASEGRSYDYRYVWIRDQCYAGQALAAAEQHVAFDGAVRFVRDRLLADGARLSPAYTPTGGTVPDEQRIELPGYPGGTDIAGNWVTGQFQLDAFGEALLLFAAAAERDRVDADTWRAAELAAAAIAERADEADAGIWELEPQHWTHSALACAAGLRAIARQAPGAEHADWWRALADQLLARAGKLGLHPSGRWQRAPGDPRVDASLLLGALRGAVPAEDPRSLATLRAVEEELTEDGYCYRFRPDERPLGEAEGSFLLCGFWLALAHAQLGDAVGAARWFERTRAACGPAGLLSEEFDVRQRQMRGNLPQGFVHALLLEAAVRLDRAG
jgi:hypothetical protein